MGEGAGVAGVELDGDGLVGALSVGRAVGEHVLDPQAARAAEIVSSASTRQMSRRDARFDVVDILLVVPPILRTPSPSWAAIGFHVPIAPVALEVKSFLGTLPQSWRHHGTRASPTATRQVHMQRSRR